jgi:hypothetical protein
MVKRLTFAGALLFLIPVNVGISAPEPAPDGFVRCGIEMRNVALHVSDTMLMHVRLLSGEMLSHTAGTPPSFDDPKSYTLRLKTAEMSMDAVNLNAMMSQVFGSGSSIRDLKISIAEGQIKQSGKLHKGVDVPFSMKTNVSATPDGRIRLHATSLKAVGVPVKGMLDLFGVELDNLMKAPGQRGIQIDGDDILLTPTEILPPPRTDGRVKDVRVSGDRLVMTMVGDAEPPAAPSTRPAPSARNYLYFHGGTVRFGKLTMTDADLQLVDANESDPFEFFPGRYLDQLVAGYSRTTRRGGLRVMMPDYSRVQGGRGTLPAPQVGVRP